MRLLACLLAWLPLAAGAISPDLKVSTDDLNEKGEHFVEFQANKASRAGPALDDARVPFQVLAEYSYGITDHWQVAVKLPFARESGLKSLGGSMEVRYLPAHDATKGGYWGVDFSAGRARALPRDPQVSAMDIQPVLGYRAWGWHFAANLGVSFPGSGEDRRATFATKLKAGRRVGEHELGVEHFLEGGPVRDALPRSQRREYLFFVWDKVVGNELNVGLGRGLTDSSERWIIKAVYSFQIFK